MSSLFAVNEVKKFQEQTSEEKVATMESWIKQKNQELEVFTEYFSKNWDKESDASRAAFCRLAGNARARNAVAVLVEHVEFAYFGEDPAARNRWITEGRVALDALTEIGVPSLDPAFAHIAQLLDSMPEEKTDANHFRAVFFCDAIKEMTMKILGKDLAIAYLKLKLKDKNLSEKVRTLVNEALKEIKSIEKQVDPIASSNGSGETPPAADCGKTLPSPDKPATP
jgi:hypothetical protein